ncbi:N-acetylmuramoyl-L-alanine amidase [Bifidobacterium dentium]|uniref:N-acetylmuramoyl-L-alanine amidase n=1 Tax=Bifidobacterium dentium TaxID=1689 RepID=UPI0018C27559|nr:N-acetylmuramoyl-L-alanine amidase [Bifidobacterium dentium]MBF9696915.1 N-acetylmuramoyl-L-alanine amidase [Bifidobacterium dentium]MBF9713074.1 N-acetylmuramoyl-L-alanine amidase [Bifidobacterium dentium]MBF9715036.1 N-acetylmuramoyl-L-alanine amidase [Bifidobacterium dentium]MBF9719013.1 N-acetylmuramoyl-L-alanine amidase [Bifidobacterium dentium]
MDGIIWKGSPNHYNGRQGNKVDRITLHVMAGYLAGTDTLFSRSSAQASSTYGIGGTGEIHQYVSEADGAWADGSADSNLRSISIEHQGGLDFIPCTKECVAASARLCADIARRHGLGRLERGKNVFLHRDVPPCTHPACPDLCPNGLDWQTVINQANQINGYEGGNMANAGDEVWNWAYKPGGKNATAGGNMYNLLNYELPNRIRDSIMQYSYKDSAPGGNVYNTICFEIPGMLKQLTKTIETQQKQISELSEKIDKLEGAKE